MIVDLISAALTATVPLTLAAIGGAIQRRSGVVSMGLEGQMLLGALFGVIGSGLSGSWIIGCLAGSVAGAFGGYLMTIFITRLRGNEIIVGLGFNMAIAGLIGFVLREVVGVSGTLRMPRLDQLPTFAAGWMSNIPFIGTVVGQQSPLFWCAILVVPATWWVLKCTVWGVRLRATGGSEAAAASLGLRTSALREGAGLIAGALAGLGGVALSLGAVGMFSIGMTAGRGYVALAAFYFGRAKPLPTALACVVFGVFDAIQIQMQTSSTGPASLLSTLPYVAVMVVLAISGGAEMRGRARRVS